MDAVNRTEQPNPWQTDAKTVNEQRIGDETLDAIIRHRQGIRQTQLPGLLSCGAV